ncbi:MAG TPA: ferritin-like fold-containing protein, partial [Actinomycetes bacterium]|nr:ferritin-like fold-containing protein [Actinomycetes bacterium]
MEALTEPPADPATDPMGDSDYRLAVVDLLGALAYGELTAFERLADDASFAPSIADKAALAA